MKGTISRVILGKGFAFIRGEDSKSYFAHCSAFQHSGTLFDLVREGLTVEFTPTKNDKGPRAEEVRVVSA